MSMFNCPECENSISDKAISCCHCGYPLQQGVQNDPGLSATWKAVEKSRIPINVFSIAMMSCAAILGVSATWIDAEAAGATDLGKDEPAIAATIVIVVMLAYGGYHLKINGHSANSCPDLAQQTDTNN